MNFPREDVLESFWSNGFCEKIRYLLSRLYPLQGKFAQPGLEGVKQGKVAVVAEGGVEVEIEYSAGVDI